MRILAGVHKGRKLLPPPKASQTRPITGSVKKSLFDILRGHLAESTVLDLYCGTGTLGLEALSRGAARSIFAERDRRVVERLRRNIEALGVADRCVVWCGDIGARLASWLQSVDGRLNVVFVDPPYEAARKWAWPAVTRKVFAPLARCLADDGRVVLRVPANVEPPRKLGGLALRRSRRLRRMVLAIYAAPRGPQESG
jgi:16S rRNA (guanine(966)-N(2))-methyltransferase RsmD